MAAEVAQAVGIGLLTAAIVGSLLILATDALRRVAGRVRAQRVVGVVSAAVYGLVASWAVVGNFGVSLWVAVLLAIVALMWVAAFREVI